MLQAASGQCSPSAIAANNRCRLCKAVAIEHQHSVNLCVGGIDCRETKAKASALQGKELDLVPGLLKAAKAQC